MAFRARSENSEKKPSDSALVSRLKKTPVDLGHNSTARGKKGRQRAPCLCILSYSGHVYQFFKNFVTLAIERESFCSEESI